MTIWEALERLKAILRSMKPAGADGFEGLCATSLAGLSGLTMRLARSGLQFGRDASSPSSAAFAISLECKRYSEDLTLDDLAGKVVIAAYNLGDRVDLWALGATSELGDVTESQLTAILGERGMTFLPLDWCPRPLPPLAVLLAATRGPTIEWFEQNLYTVDRTELAACLDAVAANPAFRDAERLLRRSVTAAEVGLDALRRQAADWVRTRLSDARLSQISFNQKIVPALLTAPAVRRNRLIDKVSEAFGAAFASAKVAVVLGPEGSGKTWLVTQWWASQPDEPILVLVAGRRADLLDPGDPVGSLAKLLSQQQDRADQAAVDGWKRRLARWRLNGAASTLRFVIVLDGLNERAGFPWADAINGLSTEAAQLGGIVAITARDAYWRRDVLRRLPQSVETVTVLVSDYDDLELDAILSSRGRRGDELPGAVREFVRNPRVCAVALDLLDRLVLTPQELSVDRLLLEYWRFRVEERGNGIGHNVEDFHRLLRNHAAAWLKAPRRRFERDDWAVHSGAAKRLGVSLVKDDLAEIDEGRFMTPVRGSLVSYEFRTEAMPFALALLLVDELRSGMLCDDRAPEAILDAILDPVRGFDRIASILAATTCLACLEDDFPERGRQALLRAWFGLQNVDASAFESMAANVPSRPATFLDYAELHDGGLGASRRNYSLTGLLVWTRRHPGVWAALVDRLPRWLGRWSATQSRLPPGPDGEEMQARRKEIIRSRLNALSPPELAVFRRLTLEVDLSAQMLLDRTAASLIAGLPQAEIAAGIVGWALAQSISGDVPNGGAELAWAIRLNRCDFDEVRVAVQKSVDELGSVCVSQQTRSALALALRLLGDRASSDKADEFEILKPRVQWRRVSAFCDTNPYDPAADPGSNIANGVAAVANVPTAELWSSMGSTIAESNFEGAMPALARFVVAPLAAKLNEVVRTVRDRTGVPLRQLAWHLPGLSPMLDEVSLRAMEDALSSLASDRTRVAPEDYFFVVAQLAGGILSRLPAEKQADLLLRLPAGTPSYQKLNQSLRPLSADQLEARLESAVAEPMKKHLRRTLISATAPGTVLSPRSREIVLDALFGSDRDAVELAGEVIVRGDDQDLFVALLDRSSDSGPRIGGGDEAFPVDRALAAAVVSLGRLGSLDLVAPRFIDWAASKLGEVAFDYFSRHVGAAVDRLLAPVRSVAPEGGAFTQFASDDGFEMLVSCTEGDASRRAEMTDPADLLGEANDLAGGARRFSERQKALIKGWIDYRASLTAEGADAVTDIPPRMALRSYARRAPTRTEEWLRRIIAVTDEPTLGRVRNIGLALAAAHAENDGTLAATAFRHLRDRRAPTEIRVGPSLVPFYELCLFYSQDGDAVSALRSEAYEDAFNDAAIESATAAAEMGGADGWLDRHVDALLGSDVPGRVAKALTISSLRTPNLHSARVLGMDWENGFIGAVAETARKSYRRASWAEHWLTAAATASEPLDFWRFALLAEGVADRRLLDTFDRMKDDGPWFPAYGGAFGERLRTAATKRTEKRGKQLCGLPAPPDDMVVMLRDRD